MIETLIKQADERRLALRRIIDETGLSIGEWSRRYGIKSSAIYVFLRAMGTARMLQDSTYIDISEKTGIPVSVLKGEEQPPAHIDFHTRLLEELKLATPESLAVLENAIDLARKIRLTREKN